MGGRGGEGGDGREKMGGKRLTKSEERKRGKGGREGGEGRVLNNAIQIRCVLDCT